MPLKDPIKRKKYLKDWYLKNKKIVSFKSKKYYLKNKIKIKKKLRIYYLKNKEKINKRSKLWCLNNSEKRKKIVQKWLKNNPGVSKKRLRKWYLKNRKEIIKKRMLYNKFRYKTDKNFKLKTCLRSRISEVLKSKYKSASTMKLIGVDSIEFVWNHLEKSFKPGMTRKNHGKWHIDHIKPCSSFDLTKPSEQRECFHYTNLQPLWASENLAKGSKIS